jgi:hypothetical protein
MIAVMRRKRSATEARVGAPVSRILEGRTLYWLNQPEGLNGHRVRSGDSESGNRLHWRSKLGQQIASDRQDSPIESNAKHSGNLIPVTRYVSVTRETEPGASDPPEGFPLRSPNQNKAHWETHHEEGRSDH